MIAPVLSIFIFVLMVLLAAIVVGIHSAMYGFDSSLCWRLLHFVRVMYALAVVMGIGQFSKKFADTSVKDRFVSTSQ